MLLLTITNPDAAEPQFLVWPAPCVADMAEAERVVAPIVPRQQRLRQGTRVDVVDDVTGGCTMVMRFGRADAD